MFCNGAHSCSLQKTKDFLVAHKSQKPFAMLFGSVAETKDTFGEVSCRTSHGETVGLRDSGSSTDAWPQTGNGLKEPQVLRHRLYVSCIICGSVGGGIMEYSDSIDMSASDH